MKFSVLLTGLAIGVVLGTFQFINTKAISEIDGLLLFPAFYGGTIVTSTLSGVLILKDRLKPKQIMSVITGVVAIVAMKLSDRDLIYALSGSLAVYPGGSNAATIWRSAA